MEKKKIIEKLEAKGNKDKCTRFEPSVCDLCAKRFEWLYKVLTKKE